MQLVFPSWKKQNKPQIQALKLDKKDGEIPEYLVETTEGKEPSAYLFEMSTEQLIRLDSNRAVLITSASPLDQQGESVSGHLLAGLISAFWFKQVDGRWYADGQQTQLDWIGAFGSIGKSKVVKLSSNQFALGVESGDCFQGACFTDLMLYELGGEKVKSLLKHSIRIAADTMGVRGDCEQILKQPVNKVIRYRHVESAQSSINCVDVKSDWAIKANGKNPGDLLIRFSGFIEEQKTIEKIAAEVGEEESTIVVDSILSPIKQQQLFRYREGKYLLVSGKNPTPEF
ncbi:hypothetical protein [Janthinobacterium sp. B9-8]|uniref:hypothetical protein n=1 Tax=Janthinobacterium sp. B9-8 TaxID=1236179 RepID=UPI0012E3502C|nr:hypothetical protein [Janthinobacterium sp. B9-8]